jgi:hypothetical protein
MNDQNKDIGRFDLWSLRSGLGHFEAQLGAGRIVQADTGGFVQRAVAASHVIRLPDRG